MAKSSITVSDLTPRQQQLIPLLRRDLTVQEMGTELGITPGGVSGLLSNPKYGLYVVLGVSGIEEAKVWAKKHAGPTAAAEKAAETKTKPAPAKTQATRSAQPNTVTAQTPAARPTKYERAYAKLRPGHKEVLDLVGMLTPARIAELTNHTEGTVLNYIGTSISQMGFPSKQAGTEWFTQRNSQHAASQADAAATTQTAQKPARRAKPVAAAAQPVAANVEAAESDAFADLVDISDLLKKQRLHKTLTPLQHAVIVSLASGMDDEGVLAHLKTQLRNLNRTVFKKIYDGALNAVRLSADEVRSWGARELSERRFFEKTGYVDATLTGNAVAGAGANNADAYVEPETASAAESVIDIESLSAPVVAERAAGADQAAPPNDSNRTAESRRLDAIENTMSTMQATFSQFTELAGRLTGTLARLQERSVAPAAEPAAHITFATLPDLGATQASMGVMFRDFGEKLMGVAGSVIELAQQENRTAGALQAINDRFDDVLTEVRDAATGIKQTVTTGNTDVIAAVDKVSSNVDTNGESISAVGKTVTASADTLKNVDERMGGILTEARDNSTAIKLAVSTSTANVISALRQTDTQSNAGADAAAVARASNNVAETLKSVGEILSGGHRNTGALQQTVTDGNAEIIALLRVVARRLTVIEQRLPDSGAYLDDHTASEIGAASPISEPLVEVATISTAIPATEEPATTPIAVPVDAVAEVAAASDAAFVQANTALPQVSDVAADAAPGTAEPVVAADIAESSPTQTEAALPQALSVTADATPDREEAVQPVTGAEAAEQSVEAAGQDTEAATQAADTASDSDAVATPVASAEVAGQQTEGEGQEPEAAAQSTATDPVSEGADAATAASQETSDAEDDAAADADPQTVVAQLLAQGNAILDAIPAARAIKVRDNQRNIFALLAAGKRQTEISDLLGLSEQLVSYSVRAVTGKLDVRQNADALVKWVKDNSPATVAPQPSEQPDAAEHAASDEASDADNAAPEGSATDNVAASTSDATTPVEGTTATIAHSAVEEDAASDEASDADNAAPEGSTTSNIVVPVLVAATPATPVGAAAATAPRRSIVKNPILTIQGSYSSEGTPLSSSEFFSHYASGIMEILASDGIGVTTSVGFHEFASANNPFRMDATYIDMNVAYMTAPEMPKERLKELNPQVLAGLSLGLGMHPIDAYDELLKAMGGRRFFLETEFNTLAEAWNDGLKAISATSTGVQRNGRTASDIAAEFSRSKADLVSRGELAADQQAATPSLADGAELVDRRANRPAAFDHEAASGIFVEILRENSTRLTGTADGEPLTPEQFKTALENSPSVSRLPDAQKIPLITACTEIYDGTKPAFTENGNLDLTAALVLTRLNIRSEAVEERIPDFKEINLFSDAARNEQREFLLRRLNRARVFTVPALADRLGEDITPNDSQGIVRLCHDADLQGKIKRNELVDSDLMLLNMLERGLAGTTAPTVDRSPTAENK